MTEEEIRAEIEELRAQIKEVAKPLQDRLDYLWKVLNGPRVTPVVHYMSHHSRYEDEHWKDDLVSAFHACDHMIDNGSGHPIGVSVGGAMTTWDEWGNDPRRPLDEEWIFV